MSGSADQLFWLSKVDEDVPKAVFVPDVRRQANVQRVYESVGFDFDADAVRSIRAADSARGVSDAEICLSLAALLLSKYQREAKVLVGVKSAASSTDEHAVVPMVLPCGQDADIVALMRDIGNELAELRRHSPAELQGLPQVLGVESGGNRHSLFDVAIAVGEGQAAIDLTAFPVDVAMLFESGGGTLRGRLLFASDLYEPATMARLVVHLQRAAVVAGASPRTAVRSLVLLGDDERDQVVRAFNSHQADFPLDRTFHALFEERVARTPAAVAVVHRGARWTYADINDRANRLAYTLLSRGLKKGAFVGILLERGCDFVVAMLGVFKAGGAYVPLDPTYPRDRVAYMLQDSEAAYLITDDLMGQRYAEAIEEAAGVRTVVCLGDQPSDGARRWAHREGLAIVLPEQMAAAPRHNPDLELNGRDRAYMIYTSGSTGRPKGAICRHDGALNHLFGELQGIEIASSFNFLQTAASSSDISVWQFMAPLLFGGATVIADYETVVDPVLLLRLMRDEQVHVAEPVPVVLRALIDLLASMPAAERSLPDLRCMMCTGEALPAELVDRWVGLYPGIPIANTYGPTETSDDVTLLVMRAPLSARFSVAPIGRPLPNVRVLVLDSNLEPLPVGVPGEICIAGLAVGEGYWRQPDKTAAAFVPCPIAAFGDGPMYRTGDLGRWLADGSIEFLGRIDQQVKVRGFRIEPGEVEGVLTAHPAIQDAAVVAVPDETGAHRLVAHFVVRDGQSLSGADLRQFLKSKLADHMVPSALVAIGALPLTPLGKVDRRALARSEALKSVTGDAFVAPRNKTEQVVAEVWARVVGRTKVGAHDNFFEIGGDSMRTIHVVTALRELGHSVTPAALFRHPTVAELAANLPDARPSPSRAGEAADPASWDVPRWRQLLAPVFPDIEDVFPLSPTQRGMYFQALLVPKSSGSYVEQVAFDLIGTLDEAAFAAAWQHVADQTPALRTAVIRRGAPYPLQVIVREATLAPAVVDWSGLEPPEQAARLADLLAVERTKGFDLKKPPLCRVTLARLAPDRWQTVWTYHHLILDGWSEPLVMADVFRAYDALSAGAKADAREIPSYRRFVSWVESQDSSRDEAFWRQQLAGYTNPVKIKDPSPAVMPPSSSEVSHGSESVVFSDDEGGALDAVSRRHGITFATLIHGAWALLLHEASMSRDVLLGCVASGRQCEVQGIEQVRGLVVTTQPLRSQWTTETSVSSWLRLLQVRMAELREHEHTPLAQVQAWSDVPAERRPLFDSIVVVGNYDGSDFRAMRPQGLVIGDARYVTQPMFALTLFVTPGQQPQVQIVYDRRIYAAATASQMLSRYRQLLSAIAANPEQRVASVLELKAV